MPMRMGLLFLVVRSDFDEKILEKNQFFYSDMPVYVDYDSADVWANQSLFQLDETTFLPKAVSGNLVT